jgi:hypothetical protein
LNCVSPLLMNAAFGVELYLKSLNTINVYHDESDVTGLEYYRVTAKPAKWGHTLRDLYDALERKIQRDLQAAFSNSPLMRKFASLEKALDAYSTVFKDSRYPFEDESKTCPGSINELVALVEFFGDYVGDLRNAALTQGRAVLIRGPK